MIAFIHHAPIIAVYIAIAAVEIALLIRFPVLWLVAIVLAILFEGR